MRDPYEILGVEKVATAEDIKAAFRRLANETHPDRNPGDPTAEARFKEINAANQILSDPARRAQWDRGEAPEQVDAAAAAAGDPRDLIPPDVAVIFEFAKEAVPEAVAAFRDAETSEPWADRAGRAVRGLADLAKEKAKTPEGQRQIRTVARMGFDFFLGLAASKPP